MKGLSKGTELLTFSRDPDDSDWFVVEMAVGGVPAIGFSIPAPYVYQVSEQELGEYLERQAISMIDRYGDRREARPDPVLAEARLAS